MRTESKIKVKKTVRIGCISFLILFGIAWIYTTYKLAPIAVFMYLDNQVIMGEPRGTAQRWAKLEKKLRKLPLREKKDNVIKLLGRPDEIVNLKAIDEKDIIVLRYNRSKKAANTYYLKIYFVNNTMHRIVRGMDTGTDVRTFSQIVWQDHDERIHMIDDLLDNHIHVGMPEKAVLYLLGKPDFERNDYNGDRYLDYNIGFPNPRDKFSFDFDVWVLFVYIDEKGFVKKIWAGES